MAVGKGGSSSNQNQSQNSQTQGNTSNANIAMPIAPQGYEDAWKNMLGTGGNTPGQTSAMNYYNTLTDPTKSGWYGAVDRNNQIAAATDPSQWKGGPTVSTGSVQSPTASQFMGQYQNPYQQQVVDATTAAANRQLGNSLSDISAQYGGQYGNGRSGVAMGQAVGDTNTALNNTIAGLNANGFNTALGAGQQDASNALTASGQNASNTLAANTATAQLGQNQNQFNMNSFLNGIQNQMGNTATAAGIGNAAASGSANTGSNIFTQGLAALGAGNPLFGSFSAGTNDAAGNSASQGQGSSSSKGGGASFG